MNKKFEILGLFTGTPKTLANGQVSAIRKTRSEKITITKENILNDEVVDQKHHGGNMRVVHHYSKINYDHLKKTFPEIADRFIPGSFGENLYTEELTEKDLCVGDTFTLGSAKIQLTVPRRPCATINNGYEDNRILKEVMQTAHVGWFYTVLEEGEVSIGDTMELINRPYPELKIVNLYNQGYQTGPKFNDLEFLQKCLDTGLMDKGWKPKLERALSK